MGKMRERRVAGGSKKGGEKVRSCRVGDTCPVCHKKEAVVSSKGFFETFGDGMAGMPHIRMSTIVFLPLQCRFCKTRFEEASESIFANIFRVLRGRGKKER